MGAPPQSSTALAAFTTALASCHLLVRRLGLKECGSAHLPFPLGQRQVHELKRLLRDGFLLRRRGRGLGFHRRRAVLEDRQPL